MTLLTVWCQTPFKIWESMAKAKPHFFISLDKFSTESLVSSRVLHFLSKITFLLNNLENKPP